MLTIQSLNFLKIFPILIKLESNTMRLLSYKIFETMPINVICSGPIYASECVENFKIQDEWMFTWSEKAVHKLPASIQVTRILRNHRVITYAYSAYGYTQKVP